VGLANNLVAGTGAAAGTAAASTANTRDGIRVVAAASTAPAGIEQEAVKIITEAVSTAVAISKVAVNTAVAAGTVATISTAVVRIKQSGCSGLRTEGSLKLAEEIAKLMAALTTLLFFERAIRQDSNFI